MSGARAQEESLARSSGLYPCISQPKMSRYYLANRDESCCIYTHHIIYSPQVPVFRTDTGELLETPYRVAFLTAPAVNYGIARRRTGEEEIIDAMRERADRVLSIAALHGHSTLILGAWGCGVFRNPPEMVARVFLKALLTKYRYSFRRVVFPMIDKAFVSAFGKTLRELKGGRCREQRAASPAKSLHFD